MSQTVSIEAFEQAAAKGGVILLERASDGMRVIATGVTRDRRHVAWVQTQTAGEGDPTGVFLGLLEGRFGQRISDMVAREMGLEANRPLHAREVQRAIQLAKDSQAMFAGMNFMTRLQLSAVSNGPEFRSACAELGLDPDALSQADRQEIDRALEQAFREASGADGIHIDLLQGRALLRQVIARRRQ